MAGIGSIQRIHYSHVLFSSVQFNIHCVQKKTHSHFLLYLHELFVDLNKNCSEYTQGLLDSDSVKSDIHCDRCTLI